MLCSLVTLLICLSGSGAVLIKSSITEWIWQSALTVDDWLYINGGELYETVNGSIIMYSLGQSIDLSLASSWTNETVGDGSSPWQPDGMVHSRQPMMWYDPNANRAYRWGGWPYDGLSNYGANSTVDREALWYFVPGTVNMSYIRAVAPSISGLGSANYPPAAAAYAASDSACYILSGVMQPNSSSPSIAQPGLLKHDFSTNTWTNSSTDIPGSNGLFVYAGAAYAPNFGKEGFLVVVGGSNPPSSAYTYEGGDYLVDMSTITLYDTSSQAWYTQQATGDVPPPRTEFCIVGTKSLNSKTFELFIYGGTTNNTYDLDNPNDDGYLNVYTLSLPAFRWFRSTSSTSVRRARHSCAIVGNHSMVSVGGNNPSTLDEFGHDPDPWIGGIGVFDMTAFKWADHYDAAAAPYDSPQVVKKYYKNDYTEPTWSNSDLASVFAYAHKPHTSTTPSSSSSTSNPSSSSSGTPSNHHSSHTGAIVGGVVGGIGGLALLAGIVWFAMRHRKRNLRQTDQPHARDDKYAVATPAPPHSPAPVYEVENKAPARELDAQTAPLSGRISGPAELEGSWEHYHDDVHHHRT